MTQPGSPTKSIWEEELVLQQKAVLKLAIYAVWRELAKVLALRDSPGVHSHHHKSILVSHRNIVSPTKTVVAQRLHWLLLLFCTLYKPRDYLELQVLRVKLADFYIQNWDRFRSDLANAEAFLNNIWEYLFSCLRRIIHSLHSRQFLKESHFF